MPRTLVGVAVAILIFVIGLAVGWVAKTHSTAASDVPTIAFYDDWRLACPASTDKTRGCAVGQDLVDAKTHEQIANVTMVQPKSGRMLAVTVPYNVLLQPGMALAFGKDKPKVYPYTTCNAVGCVAQIPVDAALHNAFRTQQQGRLLFEVLNKRVVQVSFSLHGFQRADDIAAAHGSEGGFLGLGS